MDSFIFCIKKSHELCTARKAESYMDETKMKGRMKDSLNAHDWVWILQIYSEKLAFDTIKDNSWTRMEGMKSRPLNWICLLWFIIMVYVSTQIKIFNLLSNSSLQEQNIWMDKDFQTDTCIEGYSADYFYDFGWELRTH